MSKGHAQTPSLQTSDIKLLRVFDAVVRNNGFAAAQAELNMASSSISESMARLESRLKIKLCERGRSGFCLTGDGRKVFDEVQRVLRTLENFRIQIGEIKGELAGTLRLGVVDAIAMAHDWNVSRVIDAFCSTAENVTLRIEADTTQGIIGGLMSERYDVAIVPIYRDIPDLELVRIRPESRQQLYCGRGHSLFSVPDDDIDIETIEDFPYVALTFMQGWSNPADVNFRELASTSYMEGVALMILSNRFVGYLPTFYAKPWVDKGMMRPLLPDQLTYSSTCYYASKRSRSSRLASTFMSCASALSG